ncbi:toxin-antitoxin system, toxin component, MazF family protein (plasmid) [Leptospira noguchii]|nr:toxin-antitoxin system, toxin component, MazF family protein [Leptospira noguchii]
MAVTSQIREPLDLGEALISDWQAAGLAKPSVFKPLIATIEQALIVKSLGHLSPKDKNALQALIRSILVSNRSSKYKKSRRLRRPSLVPHVTLSI